MFFFIEKDMMNKWCIKKYLVDFYLFFGYQNIIKENYFTAVKGWLNIWATNEIEEEKHTSFNFPSSYCNKGFRKLPLVTKIYQWL